MVKVGQIYEDPIGAHWKVVKELKDKTHQCVCVKPAGHIPKETIWILKRQDLPYLKRIKNEKT